jgi:hypothetical protein
VVALAWLVISVGIASPGAGSDVDPGAALATEGGGGGYHLAHTGLWLGGYATLEGSVLESAPASLGLGDIGLLIRYDVTPRLTFFNELDLDDTVTWVEHDGLERGSRILLLERLYLDWAATPELTFRVGKFLTPFGIWNVIRRAPLTWTVDRPVATQSAFPEHITGAGLTYQTTRHGWTVDATAYGQAQDELVRGATDISASAAAGGRVAAGRSLGPAYAAWGFSVTGFRNRDTGRWEDSYGTDFDVTVARNHLTGELAYSHLREAHASRDWGLYVQDVVPLYGALYGVLRYEHTAPRSGPAVNGELVGLAWRIHPHVILKCDYQFADHDGSAGAGSALERGFVGGVTFVF